MLDRFIAAFEKGDLDTVAALIHPDAVVREAAGLPYSGDYEGPDGFRLLLGTMMTGYGRMLLQLAQNLELSEEELLRIMGRRIAYRT